MTITKKILSDYYEGFKKITDEQFQTACNTVGIEVEEVLLHPKTKDLEIVKILEVKKHPNADSLNLVHIRTKSSTKWVVCGANNVSANKYAIYAKPGVSLYNNMKLEKKTIRGIESSGMLCAYSELTNINSHLLSKIEQDGIILFDNVGIASTKLEELVGLDDTIYNLALPSNRTDLNNVLFLIKELSLPLNYKFDLNKYINVKPIQNKLVLNCKKIQENTVKIDLKNIQVYKPTWDIKQRLMSCGIKLNNDITDLFSYVSLLSGLPILTFDLNKLDSAKIKIEKKSKINDQLMFNQQQYIPTKDDYLVTVENNILGLASIIENDKFKLTSDSKNCTAIINISDFFQIRSTASKLKVKNAFVNNVVKEISPLVLQSCLSILNKELNRFKIDFKITSNISFPSKLLKINVDYDKMQKFIGAKLSKTEVQSKLKSLNIIYENNHFIIPPNRIDITDQYDLFEEVLKFVNINKLAPQPITFSVLNTDPYDQYSYIYKLLNYLIDNGFYQAKTYNLTSVDKFKNFNVFDISTQLKIQNPISNIREYLKLNSVDSLLSVLEFNNSRKRSLNNVFEISKVLNNKNGQDNVLTILFTKTISDNSLFNQIRDISIFDTSNIILNLLAKINIKPEIKIAAKSLELTYDKQSLDIYYMNQFIGKIFEIKKSYLKNYKLEKTIFGAVINLSLLNLSTNIDKINAVSDLSEVKKDINFVLNNTDSINEIVNKIRQYPQISSVNIKSVYKKDDQSKTWTLAISITPINKTMTTAEIDEVITNLKLIHV